MVRAVLLGLAADDALADAVLGGGEEDSLRGSGAGETLVGFAGDDALLGGAGDDFIEARDGERDHVWCGPGDDAVSADPPTASPATARPFTQVE